MSDARLPEQWVFSKETAFRIPQLMRELRESIPWKRMKSILKHPPVFIRRVLTSKEQDKILARNVFPKDYPHPIIFDFTFSDRFQNDFERYVDRKVFRFKAYDVDIKELSDLIVSLKQEWPIILDAFVATHILESSVAERLRSFSIYRYSSSPDAEKFRWLSEFYSLYSRCSHFGFATKELTRIHFNNAAATEDGCPPVMAYLLRAKERKDEKSLPKIEGILKIGMDGVIHSALKRSKHVKQVDGKFVLGFDLEDDELKVKVRPKSISMLFGCLYNVFNERKSRTYYHQVFVPVYERNSFTLTAVQNPQRFSIGGTGAFLGWLCCDFGDDPPKTVFSDDDSPPDKRKWLFGHGSSRNVTEPFYNFLVGLRFLLTYQFSERYLQGEMEWALEQPKLDNEPAEEFVAKHVHHGGGWFGDSHVMEPPRDFSGFFGFRESSTGKFVGTENHKHSKGIDELWIDLARTPDWEKGPAKKSVILKLMRRPETALPANFAFLHDYGRSVAKSLRDFYDKSKLIEFERNDTRLKEWTRASHEIKQIAMALSGRWLIRESQRWIAPFPDLFSSAGALVYLWCPKPDFRDLFPAGTDDSFELIVRHCWKIARDAFKAMLARYRNLADAEDLRKLDTQIRAIDEAWRFEDWMNVADAKNLWPTLKSDQSVTARDWVISILRLMVALFKDVVRHSNPDCPLKSSCVITSGGLYIRIHNRDEERGGSVEPEQHLDPPPRVNRFSEDEILNQINNVRDGSGMTASTGKGSEIIKDVLQSLEALPPNRVICKVPGEFCMEYRVPLWEKRDER